MRSSICVDVVVAIAVVVAGCSKYGEGDTAAAVAPGAAAAASLEAAERSRDEAMGAATGLSPLVLTERLMAEWGTKARGAEDTTEEEGEEVETPP